MFKSPFSKGFWQEAARSARSLRTLIFCALCMAASIILGYFYIPITESLQLKFTYLATSTVGLVCGPVAALLYGFTVDILDFFMHPGFSFFFGYTLTAFCTGLFYGCFLHKKPMKLWKILLAQALVSLICYAGLNTLWTYLMGYGRSEGFIVTRLIVNLVSYPIYSLILILLSRYRNTLERAIR